MIIIFNIGPGNTGPKRAIVLKVPLTVGVARKKKSNHYHAPGTVRGLPGAAVLTVVCAFFLLCYTPINF